MSIAVEAGVDALELAADALDVRGDGRVVDHDVRVAHQLVAVLHVPREARERVHQPELGQREVDDLAAPRDREALHVQAQRAALDDLFAGGRLRQQVGAAEERADAREELRQATFLVT